MNTGLDRGWGNVSINCEVGTGLGFKKLWGWNRVGDKIHGYGWGLGKSINKLPGWDGVGNKVCGCGWSWGAFVTQYSFRAMQLADYYPRSRDW